MIRQNRIPEQPDHDSFTVAFMAILVLMALSAVIMLLDGCHKKPSVEAVTSSIVERAVEEGKVVMQLPTTVTFDKYDLPAGVDPKDVAAVVTLKEDPIVPAPVEEVSPEPVKTFDGKSAASVSFDKGIKSRVVFPSGHKGPPSKSSREIIVMKSGEVIAGVEAAQDIVKSEKVKPSFSWMWWVVVIALVFVAMMVALFELSGSFTPITSLVSFLISMVKRFF